jgi:hypothetical protein
MTAKPERRWYQFSLRTMFVGTAAVAILLAQPAFLFKDGPIYAEFHHHITVYYVASWRMPIVLGLELIAGFCWWYWRRRRNAAAKESLGSP